MREFNVWVEDLPFDPYGGDRVVYYKSQGERWSYKVSLFLNGMDVPFVRSVTYKLPSSFDVSFRRVVRSLWNPNCKLVLWVWGKFEVRVWIETKKGHVFETSHYLDFDRYFDSEKFKAKGLRSQKV